MYWCRSLVVTVILIVIGFVVNTLQNNILTLMISTSQMAMMDIAALFTIVGLASSFVIHFFVLWWAFRYYDQQTEKRKRKDVTVNIGELLNRLNEDEITELRTRLLPPSQRDLSA
ncbi:MAG: hypothetical protein K8L97_24855 [Anaerolineae bacterium]|nr:hypothetical protein [Anaerolineae bacterium]